MTKNDGSYGLQIPDPLLDFGAWVPKISSLGIIGYIENCGAQSIVLMIEDDENRKIRIYSEMHDYEERGEAGQICFEILDSVAFSAHNIECYLEIGKPVSLKKLVLRRNGIHFESGLHFRLENGTHFYLVASAAPYFLSITGLDNTVETTTEFEISEYEQQVIFES